MDAFACLSYVTRPAPPEQLSIRVASFLAHWFLPDIEVEVKTVVINDWCDVLDPYPLWAIVNGVRRYLSEEARKPTPASFLAYLPTEARMALTQRAKMLRVLEQHKIVVEIEDGGHDKVDTSRGRTRKGRGAKS